MATLEKETMEQVDSTAVTGTPTDLHAARQEAEALIKRIDAVLAAQEREQQEKMERRERARKLGAEFEQAITEGAAAEGITPDQFMDEIEFHRTIPTGPVPEPEVIEAEASPEEPEGVDPEPARIKTLDRPRDFVFETWEKKDPLAAGLFRAVIEHPERRLTNRESWIAFKRVLVEELNRQMDEDFERLGPKMKRGDIKNYPFRWNEKDLIGHGIKKDDPRHEPMLGTPISAKDLHTRTRRRLSQANMTRILNDGKKPMLRLAKNVNVVGA